MKRSDWSEIESARRAALEVLLHNAQGPFEGLPRTAGWGYPEPYTRDLMLGSLGMLVSGNATLQDSLRQILVALAEGQSARGLIPSLAHDPSDLGASDTTPLFLIGLALYRKAAGELDFLADAAQKALTWLEYQSPDDALLVAQQPTSDWRDEQWVLGHGLYVNVLVYLALRLHERWSQAASLHRIINSTIKQPKRHSGPHQGFLIPDQPHYALWVYKGLHSDRFDLLGNSLAILTGLASPARSKRLITWIEMQCQSLRAGGQLAFDLPPCFFPYINPTDRDWQPRYAIYNPPGHYHNGGVWPFICGFYITALVAAGQYALAEQKLAHLTRLVRISRNRKLDYGFNEWFRAQDGAPQGQDWQSWSASVYLYAAAAVEQRTIPLLDIAQNYPLR